MFIIVMAIPKIYVDIAGEILNPGVYVLEEGSRVNDLIILLFLIITMLFSHGLCVHGFLFG